jgi:serine/threonine-protein kinase
VTTRDFEPGRIFGASYTVRAKQGSTAWATTYAGITAPRRSVAIKIYEPSVGRQREVLAALERADRVTLAMPAHLVLEPLAAGTDAESGAFYRVTLLSGHPSLAQLTDVCPLSLDELVGLLENIARVLGAAHERGLVHGALKPTNVFVGPSPKHAVQLGDFGASVCALASARSAIAPGLEWLAPEQRARAGETPATDVFGLALVAFHALTRASFAFASNGTPAASASAQARDAGVALPSELDEVFVRALAHSSAARYANATELAAAFRAAMTGVAFSQSTPMALATTAPAPFQTVPAGSVSIMAATQSGRALGLQPKRTWMIALLAFGAVGTLGAMGWTAWTVRARARSAAAIVPTKNDEPPTASASSTTPTLTPTPTPTPTTPTPTPAPLTLAPIASASAAPSASPVASAASDDTELTSLSVQCVPGCEYVMVDGKSAKKFPLQVNAGAHGVGVSRRGFFGDWRKVVVKKGEHPTVKFRLLVDPKKNSSR